MNHSGPLGKTKGGKGRIFHRIFISADPFFLALHEPRCCLSRLLTSPACASLVCGTFHDADDAGKNLPGILVGRYIDENVPTCPIMSFP